MKTVPLTLRFLLAAVLGLAAFGQGMDFKRTHELLEQYRLLSDWQVIIVTYVLVGIEALLCLWLVSGWRTFEAAWGVLVLSFAYAVWSATGMLRGLEIANFGGFGELIPSPLSWLTVLGYVIMMLVSWMLYRMTCRR